MSGICREIVTHTVTAHGLPGQARRYTSTSATALATRAGESAGPAVPWVRRGVHATPCAERLPRRARAHAGPATTHKPAGAHHPASATMRCGRLRVGLAAVGAVCITVSKARIAGEAANSSEACRHRVGACRTHHAAAAAVSWIRKDRAADPRAQRLPGRTLGLAPSTPAH